MSNYVKVVPDGQVSQGAVKVANPKRKTFHRRISKAVARNAKLFVRLELYFMAFVSIGDLLSDLVMVGWFFHRNQISYAMPLLIFVGLNLVFQSISVFLNYPLSHQLKEQAIVWTLLKPAVDAHRLASEVETQVGAVGDARSEMTLGRIIEMVVEAIPGTIIQAMAMFSDDGDRSWIPILALLSSASFCAFISAQLSAEWDASKEKRKMDPRFYGFLPRSLTQRCFVLLMLSGLSFLNLIIRALSLVILAQMSTSLAVAVFGGELGLYFLVKIARGDFQYWIMLYGPPGQFASFMMRLLVKLTVDWTACVQFRQPDDVGGLYFSFTLLLTCAIGIFSSIIHGDATLTQIIGCSCGGLIFAYALLLMSIKREYVATFYDTRTGVKYYTDRFYEAEFDEQKFDIFANNENIWRHIRDDVKTWFNERLPSWLESQPAWLTDYNRSLVPDWVVEDKSLLPIIRSKKVLELRIERLKSNVAMILSASSLSSKRGIRNL
mmetsp:Transcript_15445/g.30798  ORF Transcript_15445/g.30798 Transcript_15445/m.30798 type:complete len:493 (+) Transcript_15445:35-1513(+)